MCRRKTSSKSVCPVPVPVLRLWHSLHFSIYNPTLFSIHTFDFRHRATSGRSASQPQQVTPDTFEYMRKYKFIYNITFNMLGLIEKCEKKFDSSVGCCLLLHPLRPHPIHVGVGRLSCVKDWQIMLLNRIEINW